ncbi:hypothetical protein [Pseudodesulfovibrio karagichevae]|uniref:Protease inhibitor Inh n=1 Tax=Pseudodesulfovibrio karagichevae TaxID=3239305 RepID=A0ABV4K2R5_9BACT
MFFLSPEQAGRGQWEWALFELTVENTNTDGEYMKIAGLNRFWLLSVVLTVVLGWGAMASAGEFNGKWRGAVTVDKKSVPAEMTVENGSSVIHFMSPFNCLVELEYPMMDSDTKYMAGVDNCSGGRCDELWNGRLILQKSQVGVVEIIIMDEHSRPWGQGTLNRQ